MEEKRPRLSPDELQQLRWLLGGLLTLLSVWTVVYLDVDAWVLTGLTTAGVLAVLLWPALPARVPPLAHKLVFPFIVVFFVWDLYTTGEALPPMIRLDLLLLLYRGTSYRKKRDDLQIIVLGLILIMIAGVLTVALEFGIQILVFTAVTLAFLFVVTLSDGAQPAAVPATGPAADRLPSWARVSWRRFFRRLREVSDWRLLTLGGLLFVGVVGVSALLFLAIPRFQLENSFFLDRFMSRKSRTGFSDTIRLGDVVDIQQDNSVALRVDVSDPARVPALPYWRMVVLDEYHDGVLRMSRRLRDKTVVGTQMRPYLQGTLRRPAGPAVSWTFYLEAGVSRFLPLTGPFYLLRFRDPQWVYQQFALGEIALRNEPLTMTAYRVDDMATDGFVRDRLFASMLRTAAHNAPAGAAESYPLTTLQLPARAGDVQALRQMVGEITGGVRLGAEPFAERATAWLRGRHRYALQVTLPGGDRDPVVAWLASSQPGHCELFTAGLTLLARAAGFPARAVTGFRGGDWNAFENYFMVRNANAHAWCEVYDGSTGWFRVDPTPGADVSGGPQSQAGAVAATRVSDRSWQARVDSIRILWYRRVVSFDQRSQLALAQSLQDTTSGVALALRATLNAVMMRGRAWFHRPWNPRRLLGWLGGCLAASAVAAAWWRWGRPWWWRLEGRRHAGHDPVRRQAGKLLRRLARRPPAGPKGAAVIADLERLRYGPRATWPEPQAAFRRARRAMRTARAVQDAGAGAGGAAGVS